MWLFWITAAALGVGALMALEGGEMALPSEPPGKYFSWREFTRSSAASRIGDPNIPGPEAQERIRRLVAVVLDPLREHLKRPVIVTSGFRSRAVNEAIEGSSPTSQHMTGEAVDIAVPGLSNRELAEVLLELGLPFDQAIWYTWKGHLHVSFTDRRPIRRQLLVSLGPGRGKMRTWRPGASLPGVA